MNNPLINILIDPRFFIPFMLWSMFWKGYALWKAATNKHLSWFILLMIINSLGLLEIAYILYLHKYDLWSKKLLKLIEKKST